ncbi:MAG: VTT domain-containing protein [Caldilineaceae bacterium]|nr:VTT domain-containing protein [Caldilineaceae bacterium]
MTTAGSVTIWRFGPAVWALFQDEEGFEAFVAGLGWLGPPALVVFNALQIVIAPIPGYVVQAAAGYLYGPFWGGVWGSLGLVSGASLAMWLSRRYGRATVARMIGGDRLARWEEATHSDSTALWFVLIFAPTGDLPYFLAGLSRVSFAKVLLLTMAIRVPATFVVAAIGAGAVGLSGWQLSLFILLLACGFGLVMRYQAALLRWVDRAVQQRVSG